MYIFFNFQISHALLSSNIDAPEGIMEALLQVAVCTNVSFIVKIPFKGAANKLDCLVL